MRATRARTAGIVERLIAGQLRGHAAHVGVALHVVLAAQRQHAGAGPPDAAGQHGEVRERHHRGGALHQLREPETPDEERRARGRAARAASAQRRRPRRRRRAHRLVERERLREGAQRLEALAARVEVRGVDAARLEQQLRQRVEERDVGARAHAAGGARRTSHELDAPRVDHDRAARRAAPAAGCARRRRGAPRSGFAPATTMRCARSMSA